MSNQCNPQIDSFIYYVFASLKHQSKPHIHQYSLRLFNANLILYLNLYQQLLMTQTKRHLTNINQSLRAEYNNFKITKDDLIQHIGALVKREKQLTKLKLQLTQQLVRSEQYSKAQKRQKAPLCAFLREELSELQKKCVESGIKVKNLQQEYEVCLEDYDKVLSAIASLLEGATNIENELKRLRESDTTMKAMIFDCERLKRVLEEEKRYFKQLCNTQQKSHLERLVELQAITKKLEQQQHSIIDSCRLSKIRIGLLKIYKIYDRRIVGYGEHLLKGTRRQIGIVKLGISTLRNCLEAADMRTRENIRRLFHSWHNNTFNKQNLISIVERALTMHHQSSIKCSILSKMQERINSNNTALLQLYQKIKYIVVIANKCSRKDQHYGFNLWRQNTHGIKRIANVISQFSKIVPRVITRSYFRLWSKNAHLITRYHTACLLLSEFEKTRQNARLFRKWRFQCIDSQMRSINQYIFRLRQRQKLTKRINYQKRKVKIITMLQIKITRIKLRNYFIKYWNNSKMYRVKLLEQSIEANREQFAQTRRQNINIKEQYELKDKNLLIKIFHSFVYRNKLLPAFKLWRNDSLAFSKRKSAIFSLVLRRQAKNKIYVMNQLRRCVQFYQKKQMHQILTNLNKKMEDINEKSTNFRDQLKNCIQNLGMIASKKIDYVTNYAFDFQKRLLFNSSISIRIKKLYKAYLMERLLNILNDSGCRQTFSVIYEHCKDQRKEKLLERRQGTFNNTTNLRIKKIVFQSMKQRVAQLKEGFSRMIHIENVLLFYRQTYGFAAIKHKYSIEKFKHMEKLVIETENNLVACKQNLANLGNSKKAAKQNLTNQLSRFLIWEDRLMRIKKRQRTSHQLQKYFQRYKRIVEQQSIKKAAVINFNELFLHKQTYVFFRNLMAIRGQQLKQQIKQELIKLNKKRKTFQQKNVKVRADTQKRLEEQIKVYQEYKKYFQFYSQRYESIINYYAKQRQLHEEQYRKKQIFIAWKYEYVSVRRICRALQRIYVDKWIRQPCHKLIKNFKDNEGQQKSLQVFAEKLMMKGKQLQRDAIQLWKINIRKYKCVEIDAKIANLDSYEQSLRQQLKQRSFLISNEVPRVNHKQLIIKVFMAFKNQWLQLQTNKRKIQPLRQKIALHRISNAMTNWKWLIYYKHTKRSYLAHKKAQYDHNLKSDVFQSLKIYRQQFYDLTTKINNVYSHSRIKVVQYTFDKIVNFGANQRDKLNYERRRAIYRLAMIKQQRIKIIKKKIMAKWNAWLIPRKHYLPSFLKRLELDTLKKAFAYINEYKYWNEYYIKGIADDVTSSGYGQINSVTNSLMREGYDPDQIKLYLKKRNQKDTNIITHVIKHTNAWISKQKLVRAFHSWKQYLILKNNIKRALGRVMNIAGGIGKYWNKWRQKDVHFNEILKKESRGNMLERYMDLTRLLKQYRRDINDSTSNLQQLKQINQQYRQKNKEGILMALNALSNNVKRGLLQGFVLWRRKLSIFRQKFLDERYDQLAHGLEMMNQQRGKLKYRIGVMRQQNKQLREKCVWGVQCGKILQKLLTEKDSLSVDLADKQHNLKLLLEDNLRLKQKMKIAKDHAQKLIRKVGQQMKND